MERISIAELSKEKAIELHRQMWSDMAKVNPKGEVERHKFKETWCKEHIIENVYNHCFLCEYSFRGNDYDEDCSKCPLVWSEFFDDDMMFKCENSVIDWGTAPIEKILNLPENKNVANETFIMEKGE